MSKILAFKMQRQALSGWCWAAAAVSISDFYGDASCGSQCELVTRVTGFPDCCQSCQDDGENSVCNQGHDLGGALWECHHGVKVNPDTPDHGKITAQIDAGHPVACNVIWDDASAHALVICGYTEDGMLQIADPEKPGTFVTINNDFVYSTTYDGGISESGKIKEVFRTK